MWRINARIDLNDTEGYHVEYYFPGLNLGATYASRDEAEQAARAA